MVILQIATITLGILGTRSMFRGAKEKSIGGILLASLSILVFEPMAISGIAESPARAKLAEIIQLARPACTGVGISVAAEYSPGEGIHPAIPIVSEGERQPSYYFFPEKWYPTSIDNLELIVCIGEESEFLEEHCSYMSGYAERFGYEVEAIIVEAHSGESIATKKFQSSASPCPETISPGEHKVIRASHVIDNKKMFQDWLEDFVGPQ